MIKKFYNFISFCFSLLFKEAKDTLCDPQKKLNYDKWKNSGITISYKQWLGMKEHVHQVSFLNVKNKETF